MCRIWDLLTGKCIRVLQGHSGRVNAVAVCDERSNVLTASDDSTARVWDMETGRCLAVLEVRRSCAGALHNARVQPETWPDLTPLLIDVSVQVFEARPVPR